jgi:hypothetical protein
VDALENRTRAVQPVVRRSGVVVVVVEVILRSGCHVTELLKMLEQFRGLQGDRKLVVSTVSVRHQYWI